MESRLSLFHLCPFKAQGEIDKTKFIRLQAAAEEAALRGRLAAVARLRSGLAEPSSTLTQSVAAYADLLDGAPDPAPYAA